MKQIFELFKESFANFGLLDFIEIILLAAALFGLYRFMLRRRAFPIFLGLVIFVALKSICEICHFEAMTYVFDTFFGVGAIGIVIIFHEEFRALFEKVGSQSISLYRQVFVSGGFSKNKEKVTILTNCISRLSDAQTGAIIVFENMTGVDEVIQNGVVLNADLSAELIWNLFFSGSPLHDGAVVIRKNRIYAAGCFLPEQIDKDVNNAFGSRHRAAIGMSNKCDALVIVVSEEDGAISFAINGELEHGIDKARLIDVLSRYFKVRA